ncbi:MAG TPA: bifunctional precorrin-2 dehydrogenase/sirohydrochlorin ferrochelatase [Coriobacteriia bacterium]|nr:bifunctional precorrin-2 dehydrogenase/sirohydrochlorin ferrochelatase [Coriobacteriia bacterium]
MGDIDTRYFPIFADIGGRPCVVAGEGPVAEKRIRQLLKYGADVVVFTPAPSESMLEAEADGKITIERRPFLRGDLHGAFLAVCATSDPEVQRAIVSESESSGCLLSLTDNAVASSYILPSITHRDPIQIAVTTAGAAPEIAKMLRKRIEEHVSHSWGPWVRLVADVRARAIASIEEEAARETVMAAVTDPSVLDRFDAGEEISVDEFLALAQTAGPAAAEAVEGSQADAPTPGSE